MLIEDNKTKLTSCIFLTPDVQRIINSLSSLCFTIKIIKEIKKAKGINFATIPNKFKKEYLK